MLTKRVLGERAWLVVDSGGVPCAKRIEVVFVTTNGQRAHWRECGNSEGRLIKTGCYERFSQTLEDAIAEYIFDLGFRYWFGGKSKHELTRQQYKERAMAALRLLPQPNFAIPMEVEDFQWL